MDKNFVVLKYQDNFADNFSTYAYGMLAQDRINCDCVYENTTDKRTLFEEKMGNFNVNCSYISKTRIDKLSEKYKYMDFKDRDFNRLNKERILSAPIFRIDDIDLINDKIKNSFKFKNLNFIKNFDILEEIITDNSVGIYINSNDTVDLDYLHNAVKRINKYLKNPKFYFFTSHNINFEDFNCKTINLRDWREEFYFLQCCKNKIIHCTKNSYSIGFWASILSNKSYGLYIYSKNIKAKYKNQSWIAV